MPAGTVPSASSRGAADGKLRERFARVLGCLDPSGPSACPDRAAGRPPPTPSTPRKSREPASVSRTPGPGRLRVRALAGPRGRTPACRPPADRRAQPGPGHASPQARIFSVVVCCLFFNHHLTSPSWITTVKYCRCTAPAWPGPLAPMKLCMYFVYGIEVYIVTMSSYANGKSKKKKRKRNGIVHLTVLTCMHV
uniref:Uncharacterized protein n=1 Tax=Myotis myotis TaxID=51298 RepID=A0A7J7RRV3_MYOMY|nr:hypothetical protein mMyoMyo1_010235 [Myotis myotis]